MRNFCKRGLCLFLTLVMLVGLLSGLSFNAAAEGVAADQSGISPERQTAIEELGKMAVAVALAYFDKGHSVQYDGKSINEQVHRFNGGKSRSTNGESPEYATPHETLYTVCSDFAHQVYMEAFGYDLLGHGAGYIWTGTLSNPVSDPETVVWSRQPYSGTQDTDMWGVYDDKGNLVKPGMFQLAKPGDVFTAFSMRETGTPGVFSSVGGHTMIWAGDVTGDGKPDIIHSGGRHMSLEGGFTDTKPPIPIEARTDRREYVDENDPDYLRDKEAYEAAIGGSYQHIAHSSFGATTNGGSIRISDAEDYIRGRYDKAGRRITLRRPAWVILDKDNNPQVEDGKLEASQYRVEHPGLAINRTLSEKTRFNSVQTGEHVFLEIELLNNSLMHVGFDSSAKDDGVEEDNTTEDGSGEVVEQASLQSEGVSATVLSSKSSSADVRAELQETSEEGSDYTVTVTETVPEGASLVKTPEGATVSGNKITWKNVALNAGEKKTLTVEYEITAELGEKVVFDGGFVGDIPSNTIPIQVGGNKLTDTQRAKLTAIANGDYNSTLAAANADGMTLGDVVYKQILGLDPKLPKNADVYNSMVKKISLKKTIGTKDYNKSSYQFKPMSEIKEADKLTCRMLVPNCWGGQYIWYEYGHERCSDPRDMHLEPGDIVVRSTTLSTNAGCQQLVYLGNGKYLSYDSATGTYPIVNEREFYRCLFYRIFYVLRPTLCFERILSSKVNENWSLNLNDNIVVNYYLDDTNGIFTDNSYVTVDGEQKKLVKDEKGWHLPVSQKAAKEMGERSVIQLTAEDAEDHELHYGRTHTVSVRDYAEQMLGMVDWDDTKQAQLGRAMIGMLNYGAESQKYFDYKTEDLANKSLTTADQARMRNYTQEKLANYRKNTMTKEDPDGLYYASSCVLGSSQALRFYLRLPEGRQDRAELNYTVRYTSYNGEERTVERSFENLVEVKEGIFYLEVPDMAAADVQTNVTLTVKKAGTVVATVTDSIASYCARIYETHSEVRDLVDAVLVYGLSAKVYFFEPTLEREENELPIY